VDRRDATLDRLARDPGSTALLVDFDGSLAAIVDDPRDAVALPGAEAVLRRLVRALGRVGVVSGRSIDFLASRLGVPDLALAGLYGAQLEVGGRRRVDERVTRHAPAVAAAAAEADALLPGVLVERKAGISVTLHWRTCPEREDEIRAVASRLAERHGLDAPQRGRRAVELRPPVAIDKGDAVRALVAGCSVAAFAGDDAGDLPAFAALDELVASGALAAAVRIGVRSDEAPAAVLDGADLVVDGPSDLLLLLGALAERVG
jgi:trehalose 6-phosphate phosphatase